MAKKLFCAVLGFLLAGGAAFAEPSLREKAEGLSHALELDVWVHENTIKTLSDRDALASTLDFLGNASFGSALKLFRTQAGVVKAIDIQDKFEIRESPWGPGSYILGIPASSNPQSSLRALEAATQGVVSSNRAFSVPRTALAPSILDPVQPQTFVTVTAEGAARAMDAWARFLASPVFSQILARYSKSCGVARERIRITLGANTADGGGMVDSFHGPERLLFKLISSIGPQAEAFRAKASSCVSGAKAEPTVAEPNVFSPAHDRLIAAGDSLGRRVKLSVFPAMGEVETSTMVEQTRALDTDEFSETFAAFRAACMPEVQNLYLTHRFAMDSPDPKDLSVNLGAGAAAVLRSLREKTRECAELSAELTSLAGGFWSDIPLSVSMAPLSHATLGSVKSALDAWSDAFHSPRGLALLAYEVRGCAPPNLRIVLGQQTGLTVSRVAGGRSEVRLNLWNTPAAELATLARFAESCSKTTSKLNELNAVSASRGVVFADGDDFEADAGLEEKKGNTFRTSRVLAWADYFLKDVSHVEQLRERIASRTDQLTPVAALCMEQWLQPVDARTAGRDARAGQYGPCGQGAPAVYLVVLGPLEIKIRGVFTPVAVLDVAETPRIPDLIRTR